MRVIWSLAKWRKAETGALNLELESEDADAKNSKKHPHSSRGVRPKKPCVSVERHAGRRQFPGAKARRRS